MMWVTLVLGIAFCVLQAYGFYLLYATPQDLIVNGVNLGEQRSVTVGGNVSESFLFIIVGAHMIHIIGGIIALLILLLLGYWKRYNVQRLTLSTEILGAYWHFVDILWIYLFIFFLVNQ
jgi:cytochrome c oxidase subunit 3